MLEPVYIMEVMEWGFCKTLKHEYVDFSDQFDAYIVMG